MKIGRKLEFEAFPLDQAPFMKTLDISRSTEGVLLLLLDVQLYGLMGWSCLPERRNVAVLQAHFSEILADAFILSPPHSLLSLHLSTLHDTLVSKTMAECPPEGGNIRTLEPSTSSQV